MRHVRLRHLTIVDVVLLLAHAVLRLLGMTPTVELLLLLILIVRVHWPTVINKLFAGK